MLKSFDSFYLVGIWIGFRLDWNCFEKDFLNLWERKENKVNFTKISFLYLCISSIKKLLLDQMILNFFEIDGKIKIFHDLSFLLL